MIADENRYSLKLNNYKFDWNEGNKYLLKIQKLEHTSLTYLREDASDVS